MLPRWFDRSISLERSLNADEGNMLWTASRKRVTSHGKFLWMRVCSLDLLGRAPNEERCAPAAWVSAVKPPTSAP